MGPAMPSQSWLRTFPLPSRGPRVRPTSTPGEPEEIVSGVGHAPTRQLPAKTLTVITAWNPGLERASRDQNKATNERLRHCLAARDYCFLPAVGESADELHREPSFAVMNLPHSEDSEDMVLGNEFGQAALSVTNDKIGTLIWRR